MSSRKAQNKIALPEDLLDVVDAEVRKGHAQSREEFLAVAVMNQVAAFRRASIDQQFAAMTVDNAYLREALQIAEEFSSADWEALQSGERSS
jgi:metal-responsive CopG/Arc/MetJ family transcriptional regulator